LALLLLNSLDASFRLSDKTNNCLGCLHLWERKGEEMSLKPKHIICILFLFLLVACGAQPQEAEIQPAPAQLPTQTLQVAPTIAFQDEVIVPPGGNHTVDALDQSDVDIVVQHVGPQCGYKLTYPPGSRESTGNSTDEFVLHVMQMAQLQWGTRLSSKKNARKK
jgi:hypothetical protein